MKLLYISFVYLSLLIFLWSPLNISAQFPFKHIEFEHLGEKSGLRSSDIYRMYQDRTGFLWICAVNGLYRYDGMKFLSFKNIEGDSLGFGDAYVYRIFEDLSSRLWAITEQGELFLYNRRRSDFFRHNLFYESEGKKEAIQDLIEGPSGQLYVIHKEHGLCVFDADSAIFSSLNVNEVALKSVRKALVDPVRKRIWALSNDMLYELKESGSSSRIELTSAISCPKGKVTNDMKSDSNGDIWLGGWYPELLKLHVQNHVFESFNFAGEKVGNDQMTNNRVNSICFDQNHCIWAGTNGAGAFILDPTTKNISTIQHDDKNLGSLSHNVVTHIMQDMDGLIWLSTWGKGLNKYTPAKEKFGLLKSNPFDKNTLGSSQVSAFFEIKPDLLCIGTNDGLNLLNYKSGKIQFFKIPESIRNSEVCIIYAIQAGQGENTSLWLGTSHGLIIFDLIAHKFTKWRASHPSEIPVESDLIYFMDKGNEKDFHVLTYAPYSLFQYNSKTKRFIRDSIIEKTLQHSNLIVVFDRQHNMWMSVDGKVIYRYVLRTKKLEKIDFQNYQDKDVSFGIGAIHVDDKDRIWIGSRQGLILLKPGNKTYSLQKLTELDGLPDRSISGILQDEKGYLWISTTGGLSKLDSEKMIFQNYYASDGLQANDFSFGSFYKSQNNKWLMFGGTNGCNIFDPEPIQNNTNLPKTIITVVNTIRENKTLDKLAEAQIKHGDLEVTITHEENVFHINFCALHFLVPERNKYSHYLEGFDAGWSTPNTDNFVTYTNLKAGLYKFMVKACNKDGLWNETPTVLWIRILPPWWKTWWAYSTYIILILAFLRYIYISQMKRQYDQLETKRLAELDQLKSRLYANITHEFRTPLTVILGIAEQLGHDSKDRMMEGLSIIKRNGKNLLALINQMLDLAKLESGGFVVNYVQGDVVGFIEYSLESFQSLAYTKKITLEFLPQVKSFVMDYDAVKLLQIISNLVSNAIKFTPKTGRVVVKIRIEKLVDEGALSGEELCIIEVSDTGMGISEEHLSHVFDRFYQADMSNTRQKEGSGIGLALSKELTLLLNGDITVQSTLGIGSVFTVKLPVHREAEKTSASIGLPYVLDFEAEIPLDTHLEEPTLDKEYDTPLVLVLEDNVDVRNYLKDILKNDFRVIEAVDGLQGIEKGLDIIPDIIISDVMMPGKDGFEVCSTLKNHEKTSHIPIIMLTARAAVEDRITGIRQGADAYIAKPFHKAELFAQIENLLEGRKKLHAKFLQYDIIKIEKAKDHELDNIFLNKLNKILEAGPEHAELTIEDISVMMNMSRMQLHRKIKALTGLSTSIYIRNIRLIRAEYILKHEHLNVSEVAYKVGFNDPKYFSRLFHDHFGYPPRDLMQK